MLALGLPAGEQICAAFARSRTGLRETPIEERKARDFAQRVYGAFATLVEKYRRIR